MKGDRHPKPDVEAALRRAERAHQRAATARDWAFILYPTRRPSEKESDAFDHSDALAGGEIGWEEDPSGVWFPCTVRAATVGEAVEWAVERLAAVGVLISDVRVALTDFRTAG
ncbi:hypothetical protein GCM10010387_04320 [Streptomyces inusitatus]|uniref:Uncharacterized protein n=1 Tax=Streptomyces inusitatus TaxID=68221 RepID=A0A918UJK6_9ACTN|nr:hypothetical protein [Streptomyces inusitatus]GGZ15171.1 hypothetical protein GCM10010387_04320 [Streptomyces inusitatus]